MTIDLKLDMFRQVACHHAMPVAYNKASWKCNTVNKNANYTVLLKKLKNRNTITIDVVILILFLLTFNS